MEPLIRIARISYGIMMGALAVQQIVYGNFRPVIMPPISFPGITICVYIFSIALFLASVAIILDRNARTIALIMGGVFLLLIVLFQLPYELGYDAGYQGLISWAGDNKELVFSGGAFVIAGSYPVFGKPESALTGLLEKLIPLGSVFVSITMICFGTDHFLYLSGVAGLVPAWIPWPVFWTEFAGAALILSGIAIILRIQLKLTALLLSLMIFLWLLMLHIPRAIADPYSLQGNEVSSVFEAFGFSGLAYIIAYGYYKRPVFTPSAEAHLPETSLSGFQK